jgi:LuxR family maltose regulon positive regulatory protein
VTTTGAHPPPPEDPRGLVLLRTKLRPPTAGTGRIARPRLTEALEEATTRRLLLVSAPAGFGKTALVSDWAHEEHPGRRVAWVGLDEGDNDPFRFWTYVLEVLRQVEPGLEESLTGHKAAASEQTLTEFVLPRLLNVLDDVDFDLVLVLDDLHVVSHPVCHRTLEFVFEHLPAHVHLCLLTRMDPPLPLSRLRVRGELAEIRSADLAFTLEEAGDLLDRVMTLGLDDTQVERLWRLTEGWPAALYLAGLSIRSGSDTDAFIASFERGHRHVFDFLGSEVLRQLPASTREFLIQTSVLRKLSAPLCDEVCDRTDSAAVITEVEKANLFLVPLDEQRDWYRYHQLFAGLLQLDLRMQAPESIPLLHRRAARWFERSGDVEEAIHHSIEGDDLSRATQLIVDHWLRFERSGHAVTVDRWLASMPSETVEANPTLGVIAAWVGGKLGAPRRRVVQWLEMAERVRDDVPPIPGSFPVPFAIPLARAINCFGDVGRSLEAARGALAALDESAGEEWVAIGEVTLGRCLFYAGDVDEARRVLTHLLQHLPPPGEQPNCAINAWALMSLLDDADGESDLAADEARRAFDVAESHGLRLDPLTDVAHLALARADRRAGHLAEAETLLTELVTITQHAGYMVPRGHALLELAVVQHDRGGVDEARLSLQRAREVVRSCEDPGQLLARLSKVSSRLQRSPRSGPAHDVALTTVETRVLRLLDTSLSQPEIARELHVSVNTVRTHIQSVYRKLGVSSRAEALAAARAEVGPSRGQHPTSTGPEPEPARRHNGHQGRSSWN